MSKPNYASLLAQIAAEDDATAKQALIDQCYIFPASVADNPNTPDVNETVDNSLSDAETELFEYVEDDYILDEINGIRYVGKEAPDT